MAILGEVRVRRGHLVDAIQQAPFDLLFAVSKFKYRDVVVLRFPYSNRDLLREQLSQLVDDLDWV